MNEIITPSNVMFALGIIGILFAVYKQFHVPQEELETRQVLTEKDVSSKATILAQKELETKALVLAEQVKGKNEENERRFLDMGAKLDTAMSLAQNHIHTVSIQVETLTELVNAINLQVNKLATILDERLPKKVRE